MKKLLLILLCVPLIGLGQILQFEMVIDKNIQEILINNLNDYYDDKAKRQDNYNDTTGNNLWIAYSDDNLIKQIGYYHNGKKNGEWVDINSSIKIINYKDGIKDGLFKDYWYHSYGDGVINKYRYLSEIGNYKKNQKSGLWKKYFKSGKPHFITEYINGEKVIYSEKRFHHNGVIYKEWVEKDGYIIRTYYYENGIIDREFVQGCGIDIFDCTNKYYNENGKLVYTTTYLLENKAPGLNSTFIEKCWDGIGNEIECE